MSDDPISEERPRKLLAVASAAWVTGSSKLPPGGPGGVAGENLLNRIHRESAFQRHILTERRPLPLLLVLFFSQAKCRDYLVKQLPIRL